MCFIGQYGNLLYRSVGKCVVSVSREMCGQSWWRYSRSGLASFKHEHRTYVYIYIEKKGVGCWIH